MKVKFGLLVIAMFAGVLMANAQGGGGGQRRTPEERTKRVVDTLNTVFHLESAVSGEVQTVFMDYYKEQDKLRESMQNGGGGFDRAAFQKLMDDRDEKLKKSLTADQFKKYKDEIEPALMPRRRPQQ
jgi:protein CpxP